VFPTVEIVGPGSLQVQVHRGCGKVMIPTNRPTSVARRDPPIKPALLAESRLVRYGEKKGKMPYEEFRKLFEQRPEPNRWQRIRLGSSIKWALAGGLCVIAVLLMR